MVIMCIAVLLFVQSQEQPKPQASSTPATPSVDGPSNPPASVDKTKSLSMARRVFVDSFGTDPISQQMQAMIISSLTESKRFTVTESMDKADVILRGVASEKNTQETHAYSSGTAVGNGHGGGALRDSSLNTESIDSARASVRLVSPEGDVIWTTTQESTGAKFKGASADVADKIARQLSRDAEKADSIIAQSTKAK